MNLCRKAGNAHHDNGFFVAGEERMGGGVAMETERGSKERMLEPSAPPTKNYSFFFSFHDKDIKTGTFSIIH